MIAPEGSILSEDQTLESVSRSLAGGRYRIMRILGAGAMGSVRLAEDTALHRRVAIKTVKEEVARNPEIRKRIERECLLHAKVGPHPNIVTLFDKLEFDSEIHLVMEYIDGETLQARLERNSDMGIVMPPSESIVIASQVLDALSRIHAQGIVHRDIKPANIMLTYTESGMVCAKLMDFGVSRFAEDNEQLSRLTTTSNGGPGTPLYMAPEQIDSKTFGEVSYATDVYAMGIMLYQLLSGRPPFRGTLTEVLNGHLNMPVPPIVVKLDGVLPESIENLLKRALAKRTADRIQSAKEFRDELIALTGVGDTMSRLHATVQLGSASSAKASAAGQSGFGPVATQTFFGGNTMMRLARFRRSVRVLGAGVAVVVVALVATAIIMMRGPKADDAGKIATNQPVGEVYSGGLAAAPSANPQPNAPPAGVQQAVPQAAPQPIGSAQATTESTATQLPAPGTLQPMMPQTGVAADTPVPSAVPGAADPQETPAVDVSPAGTVVAPGMPPTPPIAGAAPSGTAVEAVNPPNPLTPTPTGAPVIVENATVQTPGGETIITAPGTATGKEYTVVSGDTLSKIAKLNSVTVEELRWWNDILNPYSLSVGQMLKLYQPDGIKPKEQFLAEAVAAEKARNASKATTEAAVPESPKSNTSNKGGTLEGSYTGKPAERASPPPQKDDKPKRGFFRGIGNLFHRNK